MIRQVTRLGAKSAMRVPMRQTARPLVRSMSGLEGKERAEEKRYFAQLEADRVAAAKAQFEAVMASDDADAKEDLIESLVKKEDQGMITKLGLDDWKMALPASMFVAIPTLANEVLVLDAETQLVACFVLFCSTMYTQLGGMVAKSLDEYRDNVYTTLKKVDESMLVDINASIAANEKVLNMEADVKSMHTLMDDMAVAQADALNYAEEHKYRDAIVKKLDSLVAIEDAAVSAMRVRMLNSVKNKVVNKFASDAKAKDAALANAMSVLSSGKIGKDIVGEIYGASLQEYRAEYAKLPKGGDDILAQLEKDIAAACSAPTVDVTGGNVYETHPITANK